jgi:hypothetical protein
VSYSGGHRIVVSTIGCGPINLGSIPSDRILLHFCIMGRERPCACAFFYLFGLILLLLYVVQSLLDTAVRHSDNCTSYSRYWTLTAVRHSGTMEPLTFFHTIRVPETSEVNSMFVPCVKFYTPHQVQSSCKCQIVLVAAVLIHNAPATSAVKRRHWLPTSIWVERNSLPATTTRKVLHSMFQLRYEFYVYFSSSSSIYRLSRASCCILHPSC